MNFINLARKRYSVRSYQSTKVENELLIQVAEAAILAPTAVNFQPFKLVIVTDPELLERLYACYHREWFKTAPACFVAIGDHDKGWHRPSDGKDYTDIDVAIAIDHLMLAATELELGTCWICHFDAEKVAEVFDLTPNLEPIAIIPIGYPSLATSPEKKRKSLNELVSWNGLHG